MWAALFHSLLRRDVKDYLFVSLHAFSRARAAWCLAWPRALVIGFNVRIVQRWSGLCSPGWSPQTLRQWAWLLVADSFDVCRIFLFLIWYSENLLGSCGLRGLLLFWTLLSELAAAWRRGACRFTLLLFSALRCQSFSFPAAFALRPCLWALGHLAIRKNERVFEAAAGKGKPKGRKERKRVKPKGYERKIRLDYVYLTVVFIHQIN